MFTPLNRDFLWAGLLWFALLAGAVFSALPAWAGDAAVHEYRQGLALARKGSHVGAVRAFTRSLELRPDFAQALNNRGLALLEMSRFAEAEQDFSRAVALDPSYHQAWNNLALARYKLGRHVQGLEDAREALRLAPNFGMPHITQGLILLAVDRPSGAAEAFTRAIQGDPTYARAYYHRALAHMQLGDREAARRDCDAALALDPNNPSFLRAAAEAAQPGPKELGPDQRPAAAPLDLQALDQALDLDPDNAALYARRGEARARMGNLSEAVGDYNRSLDLDPSQGVVYNHRGIAHAGLGLYGMALDDLDWSIALDSSNAQAFANRGSVLLTMGQLEAALADLNRSIILRPEGVVALNNRGCVLLEMDRLAPALRDFERTLALDPEYHEARANRGLALILLGRMADGCEELTAACARGECRNLEWAKGQELCAHWNRP